MKSSASVVRKFFLRERNTREGCLGLQGTIYIRLPFGQFCIDIRQWQYDNYVMGGRVGLNAHVNPYT
jgi:hypothetical protein